MDLSIIIVNYNSEALLEKCITSIVRSNPSVCYEIIIVDNGSKPPIKSLIEKIKNNHKNIPVLLQTNSINSGFGSANNQGVEIAQGEYLLFLNVDTEVIDQAIDSLYTAITTNNSIDIIGGKLLNVDQTDQPSCGPFYTLPVIFGMLFLKGDTWGLTRWSPKRMKKVDWISGACIMMKKETFLQIGQFDTGIFMYMEEIDLLYRASKLHFSVYFDPHAQFIHIGAATSGNRSKPILNIYKGLVFFYKKHTNAIQYSMLKIMLIIKALLVIIIGKLINNKDLALTYKKALSNL